MFNSWLDVDRVQFPSLSSYGRNVYKDIESKIYLKCVTNILECFLSQLIGFINASRVFHIKNRYVGYVLRLLYELIVCYF